MWRKKKRIKRRRKKGLTMSNNKPSSDSIYKIKLLRTATIPNLEHKFLFLFFWDNIFISIFTLNYVFVFFICSFCNYILQKLSLLHVKDMLYQPVTSFLCSTAQTSFFWYHFKYFFIIVFEYPIYFNYFPLSTHLKFFLIPKVHLSQF